MLYAFMNNITSLIQNHTEYLELASFKASNIHSTLETISVFAGSWNQNSEFEGSLGDFALRIAMPLATLILGNYGLHPSFKRNAALILGGMTSLTFIYGGAKYRYRHRLRRDVGSFSASRMYLVEGLELYALSGYCLYTPFTGAQYAVINDNS